jgi:hypothetical protein
MKIKLSEWTISKCHRLKGRINPKPQFQRTPVWSEHRKQLLIDSILRGYDIPKVYLNNTPANLHHDFEVADGQQRLRAIWEYIEGGFNLNSVSHSIDGKDLSGLGYEDLPNRMRRRFEKYNLTISIISKASPDELRVLFSRLQMGMSLTPSELRNAIPCALAPAINLIVETHPFFINSSIPNKRYNHQDFLTHALLLADKGNVGDLKAPDLKAYYETHARSINTTFFKRAHRVLDDLALINVASGYALKTKWGFVDLFWLVYRQHESGKKPNHSALAKAFVAFEAERRKYVKRPDPLLKRGAKGRDMYDYIAAFIASGAKKDNVGARGRVFERRFATNFS